MKKFKTIFSMFLAMLIMFIALFFVGAIYDTGKNISIETYFFQPNFESDKRPGVPPNHRELGENGVRNRLISKFITEYFYVIPDVANAQQRMSNNSLLYAMTMPSVFNKWQQTIAPQIEKMAEDKMFRTVSVISINQEPTTDNFWRVDYETKTWEKPNDLIETPKIEYGTLFLKIIFEPDEFRINYPHPTKGGAINMEQYLEMGGDPSLVFRFKVSDVTNY